MRNLRLSLMTTVAALGCFGLADSANAQYAVYGGGATFPSVAYRNLFDCFGVPINAPLAPAVATACGSASGNIIALGLQQILYAPVGSGAGKTAFAKHDPTALGTPATANTVPYTSALFAGYPYPSIQFAGSDDILIQADVDAFNLPNHQDPLGGPATLTGAQAYGAILQIPSVIGAVGIAFAGKDGNHNPLTYGHPVPPGGTSGLNLSRKAFCGIFSGNINTWDDATLTADNGGTPLGTGQITVVHRSDGSGTTFLFSNALHTQCSGIYGTVHNVAGTIAKYDFPWVDKAAPASQCPAGITPLPANGLFWPGDTGGPAVTDQCGNTVTGPTGSAWGSGSGNGGVIAKVAAVDGAIGYASVDFVQPKNPSGPLAANLQNQYDIFTNATVFEPPTAAGAKQAMKAANPFFDTTSIKIPLAWSAQGTVANPTLPGAYPIAGFSWLDLYQCYLFDPTRPVADVLQNYVFFHYIRPEAAAILDLNGFAVPPQEWINYIGALVFDPVNGTPIGYGGDAHCGPIGVPPGRGA